MNYILTVKYPKQEVIEDGKESVTNIKENIEDASAELLLEKYQEFKRVGYDVKVNFVTSDVYDEFDVFKMAEIFDLNAIDYSAKLKFINRSNKGSHDYISSLAKLFDRYTFDYDISIKLKVNEKSEIDFQNEDTWFGETPIYQINPKIKVKDAKLFKNLYDELNEIAQVSAEIKPKEVEEKILLLSLDNYPAGTEVVFTLKDSEIYE